MEISVLKEIGLTNNEAKSYIEMLKHDNILASELSDLTGLNRTMIYQILKKLIKLGLIGYVIKNNTKYFKASNPSRLIEILKEKELNIKKLIPELTKLSISPKKEHNIEVYEGKEGLKTLMNDIIKSKPKEWLDITSGLTIDILPDYFMNRWEKERTKAKIKARFLMNNTKEGKKRGMELKKLRLSEVKYLPKGLNSPSHIYIYENKVGITLWNKDFPFAILIENKETAGRFKEFFEWFWKITKN
ncbi:hypothetical protein HYT26_03595 [Candidatus Pacearchaeota archaeon]|nr:hypothetical protein [Candidatus Pacearchaeota archaeon]